MDRVSGRMRVGKCDHSFRRQDRIFGLHIMIKPQEKQKGLKLRGDFKCKTESHAKVRSFIKAVTFSAFTCIPVMIGLRQRDSEVQ